jgi:hypothetical protein
MLTAEFLTNKKKHRKLFRNDTMSSKRRGLLDLIKIFNDIEINFKIDDFKRPEKIKEAI